MEFLVKGGYRSQVTKKLQTGKPSMAVVVSFKTGKEIVWAKSRMYQMVS